MKIREIIIENDTLAAAAGRHINKGKQIAQKILSPSKWLSGSSDDSDQSPSVAAKGYEIKQTLSALAQNQQLGQSDMARIKMLYTEIKSGKRSVRVDASAAQAALKRVLDNAARVKDDNQLFANLANEF